MSGSENGFNIILGYHCNYRCGHCVSSSGPHRKRDEMNAADLAELRRTIGANPPPMLMFTGGEPTLYIDLINTITAYHPHPDESFVQITTNGWFASTAEKTRETLDRILLLGRVQMSFDVFHGNESKLNYVENLAAYCTSREIEFNVTMCLSEPAQLIKAHQVMENLGVKVTFQKVTASGRAVDTGTSYHFPLFQKDVLKERCPNLRGLSYFPGKGYSTCCSNLTFRKDPLAVIHASPEEHKQSPFYKNLDKHNMGELARIYGVDLSNAGAELSSVCNMCEYIHAKAGT